MERGQAEVLLPMVDAAIRDTALRVAELDLVAVTVGPGSFTGIRVGLAAAQGIVLAAGLPLLGVTGFEAVAAANDSGDTSLLLIALESRRAELFVQVFDRARPLTAPAAVPPASLAVWIEAKCGRRPLRVAGDATARAAAALAEHRRLTIASTPNAVAVGVAREALRRWRRGERKGRTEPLYLRPPAVTRPAGRAEPSAL
jgi:tRNA threonylcarbamoyladenosine biosynthesis protein TsaB